MINLRQSNLLKIIFFCCVLTLSLGCAATEWPTFSGFLNDYKGMYRSNEVKGMFIITHSYKSIGQYSKFIVDPVVIYLKPDAEAAATDPAELKIIGNEFYDNIVTNLGQEYDLVDKPGQGVLRIRTAITDVTQSKFWKGISGGTIEAEFIDTTTQERILAVLHAKKGKAFKEWAELLKDRLDTEKKEQVILNIDG